MDGIKVRVRHRYRGVPYELEFTLSGMSQLSLLSGAIDGVVKFIDKILERRASG